MKLSNETISILKNFSQIHSGFLFKKGSVLFTISGQRTIVAKANIKEEIPKDFGIYDLNNFLSVSSLFKDGTPELQFDDSHVIFKNGDINIYYRTSHEDLIFDERNRSIIAEKTVPNISSDVSFTLSQENFEWILKTSNVLGSPNIAVASDGNEVKLVSYDASNDSCSKLSMLLPNVDCGGNKFNLIFKTENLKLIPKTYKIDISYKGISKFTDTDEVLTYWIALESAKMS